MKRPAARRHLCESVERLRTPLPLPAFVASSANFVALRREIPQHLRNDLTIYTRMRQQAYDHTNFLLPPSMHSVTQYVSQIDCFLH